MIWFMFLACIALVSCKTANQTDDKLVFAQTIFRHGDRTIRLTYPNDPYKDDSNWPEGYAQLTNLGKKQEYELGKFFGRRYEQLLGNDGHSSKRVYAISSEYDRTINSALLVLAGMLPPKSNEIWNENLLWQPIPVHVIPRAKDHLIVAEKVCPQLEAALDEYRQTPEIKALLEKHRKLFEHLEKNAGQPIRTLEHLKDLHGVLDVERLKNKTLPEWTQKVFVPGGDMDYLAAYWLKFTTETTLLKKLKSGFLFKEILDRFTSKSLSKLSPDRSLWMYSGHDVTVAAMLNSLGLFEPHLPPYASSLLFEMYETKGSFYIQMFYRNSTTDHLTALNIPKCGTKCSLTQLYEIYADILPTDYETDCTIF